MNHKQISKTTITAKTAAERRTSKPSRDYYWKNGFPELPTRFAKQANKLLEDYDRVCTYGRCTLFNPEANVETALFFPTGEGEIELEGIYCDYHVDKKEIEFDESDDEESIQVWRMMLEEEEVDAV